MKKYMLPLFVFVTGHVLLLVAFLFLSTIGTSVETGVAGAADYSGVFWGWAMFSNSSVVKFLVLIIWEMFVLYGTAMAFLKGH